MVIVKLLAQTAIILCFLGGSFFVIDDWKTAAAVDALLLLAAGQILFLTSRTTVKSGRNSMTPHWTIKTADEAKETDGPTKPPPKGKLIGDLDGGIKSDFFSRFQKNLTRSRRGGAESDGAAENDRKVVVSISSKSKRRNRSKKTDLAASDAKERPGKLKGGGEKSAADATGSADGLDSIFDDMREPQKPAPAKILPKTKIDPGIIAKKLADLANERVDRKAPLVSHETLTSKDLKGPAEASENEAEMFFAVANRAYRDGNFQEGLATVRKWFQSVGEQANKNRELLKLKADCEFALQHYEEAAETYQIYVKEHLKVGDKDYLEFLDEVGDKFARPMRQQDAVPFYFAALTEHRKARNHAEMDRIYSRIEIAYREIEDWIKLIQSYQSHISIKKVLKDYKGQLEILDHLGKLQYDQGDAAGSKKSYEQSIAIREEMHSK